MSRKMADKSPEKRKRPRRNLKYGSESAAKKAKKENDAQRSVTRVSIMNEWDRWHRLKVELKLKSDAQLAQLLLDR